MSVDFKKKYKDYYYPDSFPHIKLLPKVNYISVSGKGNPNDANGEYQLTIGYLYTIMYIIKMSYKKRYNIEGYYDFVVPPLEGFWWQEGIEGVDYSNKSNFCFISIIRLPEFVTREVFEWAVNEATKKKKKDFKCVNFLEYNEGLCVECLHIGSFDEEPTTVSKMHEYIKNEGYEIDITNHRYHHEIYSTNNRNGDVNKFKTVIRHPIKIKLELKEMTHEDLTIFMEWLNKPHVKRWYHNPNSWINEIVDKDRKYEWINHFIVYNTIPVGFCQYYPCIKSGEDFGNHELSGSYSIDYLIGDEKNLKIGYGKQIINLLVNEIKTNKDAKRILVQPEKENTASCKLLESCGFVVDKDGIYMLRLD